MVGLLLMFWVEVSHAVCAITLETGAVRERVSPEEIDRLEGLSGHRANVIERNGKIWQAILLSARRTNADLRLGIYDIEEHAIRELMYAPGAKGLRRVVTFGLHPEVFAADHKAKLPLLRMEDLGTDLSALDGRLGMLDPSMITFVDPATQAVRTEIGAVYRVYPDRNVIELVVDERLVSIGGATLVRVYGMRK